MESIAAGDLVTITTTGAPIDGIVAGVPSAAKAVVAMVDRKRGPVLRSFEQKALSERETAGPDDRALQLLIRRTPAAVRGKASAGGPATAGREAHTRGAMHRSTGK